MLILAIAGLVVSCITLIGGGYVLVKNFAILNQRIEVFEDFLSSPGEGKPSPLGQLIGQAGGAVAVQVTEGVSNAIYGSIGGSMKGATAELEKRTMEDNPALAILDGMPKAIKKNPLAMMAMQTLINKNLPLAGQGGGGAGGNHNEYIPIRNNDSGMWG